MIWMLLFVQFATPPKPPVTLPASTPVVIQTYPDTVGLANKPAAPTPVNLGRDMTPTTEHIKPKVVPSVVKVTIAAPALSAPAAVVKPVKLAPIPYDGSR